MAALTAALLGLSAVTSYAAQRKQGEYEAHGHDVNASLADGQAADAIARGNQEAGRQARDTRAAIGSQRAGYASQGVQVDNGSALDVQADTAQLGELDRLTILNNAKREAYGYQVDATNSRAAGEQARSASRSGARTTLLTAASQLYTMGRESGTFNRTKTPSVPKGTSVKASSYTPQNYG